MAATLPNWLTHNDENGVFEVDPDLAYPLVLEVLGVKLAEADQYAIEVAYQCAKLAAQEAAVGAGVDPAKTVLIINTNADGGRKDRWALAKFPPGRGVAAATKGRAAKALYARVRPALLAAA